MPPGADGRWVSLRKSFITDPLSEIMGPHGTVDPRQGGANMDPRQLVADGVVQGGLLHLHSQMCLVRNLRGTQRRSSIHLMNGFAAGMRTRKEALCEVYPWRYRGWRHYYIKSRCKCNTALVLPLDSLGGRCIDLKASLRAQDRQLLRPLAAPLEMLFLGFLGDIYRLPVDRRPPGHLCGALRASQRSCRLRLLAPRAGVVRESGAKEVRATQLRGVDAPG